MPQPEGLGQAHDGVDDELARVVEGKPSAPVDGDGFESLGDGARKTQPPVLPIAAALGHHGGMAAKDDVPQSRTGSHLGGEFPLEGEEVPVGQAGGDGDERSGEDFTGVHGAR